MSNTNYFAMIDDDNDFEMWQGLRGPAGPTGPAGHAGQIGPRGPAGEAGPAGADGKSAYEAAQEGGYTGTESQFNAALAEIDTALHLDDVDDALSDTSENPVQNKVITQELTQQKSAIDDLTALANRKAGMLVDTASGAIASFVPDSTIPDLLGVSVAVEPVQDLHGYDNPWPAGGGKNKLDNGASSPYTTNGITFVKNADGSVTANGTATDNAQYIINVDESLSGDFYFVCVYGQSNDSIANAFMWDRTANARCKQWDGSTASLNAYNGTLLQVQLVSGHANRMTLRVMSGKTISNFTFYPMICASTETDATYAPYSNICPITGWDSVTVNRTGKNLNPNTGVNYTTDNATRVFLRAGTYTLSTNNGQTVSSNNQIYIRLFDAETGGNTITSGNISGEHMQMNGSGTLFYGCNGYASVTVTIAVDCWFAVGFNDQLPENFSALQVEPGSTASAYVPYNPSSRSISISFGSTVYSGTLDATNGTMKVTLGSKTLNGTEEWAGTPNSGWYTQENNLKKLTSYVGHMMADTLPAGLVGENRLYGYIDSSNIYPGQNWIYYKNSNLTSTKQVKAFFAANPTQVVYELATPFELTLTPQQISALKGTNNVWSDAGDVTVEYAADIKAYIDRLNQSPEDDMIANTLIAANKYFTVNNRLFLSTASIAAGAQIIPGTNCTETSLVEALNALNA